MVVPEAVVSHQKLRVLHRVRVAVGPAASAVTPQIPNQVLSARGFDFLQVYIYIYIHKHAHIHTTILHTHIYVYMCTYVRTYICIYFELV